MQRQHGRAPNLSITMSERTRQVELDLDLRDLTVCKPLDRASQHQRRAARVQGIADQRRGRRDALMEQARKERGDLLRCIEAQHRQRPQAYEARFSRALEDRDQGGAELWT